MNLRQKIVIFIAFILFASGTFAQDFGALARVDAARTSLVGDDDGIVLRLGLSQPVPFRIFTLSNPDRIVLDFKEIDWTQMNESIGGDIDVIENIQFGPFRPGWSRLVLGVNKPMAIETLEMQTGQENLSGLLELKLKKTDRGAFDARVNPPADPEWAIPDPVISGEPKTRQDGSRPIVIAIDPGHGGIDKGASYAGHQEKSLVLQFGLELKEGLIRSGRYRAEMTRDSDVFLSLPGRIAAARAIGADVFISLHADAVTEGSASGITVYTVSEKASDKTTQELATRLDRADILAGVDLREQDDVIAGVLIDMARVETTQRSEKLAEMMVKGFAQSIGRNRSRPHLSAGFAVLKAPDIPSILIELGFMTHQRDLQNLLSPDWRQQAIEGVIAALDEWAVQDAAEAKLLRQ